MQPLKCHCDTKHFAIKPQLLYVSKLYSTKLHTGRVFCNLG